MASHELEHAAAHGLYDPSREHDACGVGFVAHIKGVRNHNIVGLGLKILENLDQAVMSSSESGI